MSQQSKADHAARPDADRLPPGDFPTASQWQGFSNCLLDLHQISLGSQRTSFIDQIFERYGELISHDAALWSGGRMSSDPLVGPVMHYVHLYKLPLNEVAPVWEAKGNVPVRTQMSAYMAVRAGQAQIVHAGTPGLEEAFERLFGFFGIRHLLGIYHFDPATRLFNILSLYRTRDAAFSEAERFMHELAAPHLLAVLRNHSLARLAPPGDCAVRLTSAAAVDPSGTLHHAHPVFIQLLREEWPDYRGPDLPAVVAPKGFRPGEHPAYIGNRIVIRAHSGGELYHFYARHKGRIDALTARERQIIEQFSDGQSHKEVARLLGLSPATVRNVLANAYRKLGVSDKAELAKLLAEHSALRE